MIISRTPYRISFFGGGTDYPSWYKFHGGEVLSTTINHYCYITTRFLPPFFKEKSRIVWSKIEAVKDNADIEHNAVRAVLKYLNIKDGVEIHHTGDLPARSGLGSSSAFTVGLLNAMYALTNHKWIPPLVYEAIKVEQEVMRENVGVQDQIAAAMGGFNHTAIHQDGSFFIKPVEKRDLEDYLLLFFTGVSRTASNIAIEQIKNHEKGNKEKETKTMQGMVGEAINILQSRSNIDAFGHLLHESWLIKRSLAGNITSAFLDDIYNRGRSAGALGGKLLGAGGGGMMLFFAHPDKHKNIKAELKEFLHIPFKFSNKGSEIIYGL